MTKQNVLGGLCLLFLVLLGIGMVTNQPSASSTDYGLTDEQRLAIVSDCDEHPKALRCQ